MTRSQQKTCTPCKGGIPPLTSQQAEGFQRQVPGGSCATTRTESSEVQVPQFRRGAAVRQQVGELAEAEGHHPDISFGWGHATVSLQTKKIKGLHENDFIMAAKIDRLGGQKLA